MKINPRNTNGIYMQESRCRADFKAILFPRLQFFTLDFRRSINLEMLFAEDGCANRLT